MPLSSRGRRCTTIPNLFSERSTQAATRMTGANSRIRHWLPTYAGWGAAALCAAAASIMAAPGLPGVFGAALAVTMTAIAAVDRRSFVIPDKLVLLGLTFGFLNTAAADMTQLPAVLFYSAMRGLLMASLFLALREAYRRLRGREGIGLGDVKLAGVAGVWLDWIGLAVAVDVAALSALAVVVLQALRGRRVTATTAIPFGLFLAPAIWVAWLWEVLAVRLAG
jgi:leader peptidase (prepilin peptidase) / N-methyltransferase